MLDNTKVGNDYVETVEREWIALSPLERRLIMLYRRLSEMERRQLRRFTEVMAQNPEEGSAS